MTGEFFRNPYHFVPVREGKCASEKRKERFGRTRLDDFHEHGPSSFASEDEPLGHGHALYAEGSLSGRIICRIEAETPIVIGARRYTKKGDYARVEPFEIDGRPAIPATSLKGLFSSIAEAASGSAMRVLDQDFPVTFRAAVNEALSAVGEIVEPVEQKGKFFLRPLAAPVITEIGELREHEKSHAKERFGDKQQWFFGPKRGNDFAAMKAKHDLWSEVFQNSFGLKIY
ncbi:MAG: hypothetical protein D6773_07670, partial [Alphaproteobacteria bacterium]